MFAQSPSQEMCVPFEQLGAMLVIQRLHRWNPDIDPMKLKVLTIKPVMWNNGSLGCPMPGRCYTQALVPGYLLYFQSDNLVIEVHTDSAMQRIALPGIGFI